MKQMNIHTSEFKPTIATYAWSAAVCLLCVTLDASANDAASVTGRVVPTSEGPRFELEWTGQPGAQYRVQSRDDLADAAGWRAVDLVRAGTSSPIRWLSPEPLRERRFYRLAGPDPEIYSVEPAIAPPNAPVTLYIRGQCFRTNDTFRLGGAVIPGGAVLSSALGRVEVPPQPPGVVRVELIRDSVVLSFFDVFFFDPGSDPFYALQGPPELPPGAPVAVAANKGSHRSRSNIQNNRLGGVLPVAPVAAAASKGSHRSRSNIQNNRFGASVLSVGDLDGDGLVDCEIGARGTSGCGWLEPTGELLWQETDLPIPGRGLDFVWTRTYRSRTGGDSPMGWGWTHSYDVFIEAAGDDVAVRDGTGRRDVFRRQDSGTFTLPGCFREGRWDDVSGNFILTFSDSGVWEFHHFNVRPAGGKLARSVDRNGNTMRFEYDLAGRLVRVIDTLGRTNTVAYNAAGRLASVTDFSGRSVTYGYVTTVADTNGTVGDLVAVIAPPVTGTPNGNDFPGGKTNRYTYKRGFADDRLNHNLSSASDGLGKGNFGVVYNATTNTADFDFDTVSSVLRGGGRKDIWRAPLTSSPSNDFATVRCIVNDFVGNVTEEYYDARHRLLRRLEFTGRANPAEPTTDTLNLPTGKLRADDPAAFETRWQWNNDSLCTAVHLPQTNRMEWVYQGDLEATTPPRRRGNLRVERRPSIADLDGDGAPEIAVSNYEHDPRFGTVETGGRVAVQGYIVNSHGSAVTRILNPRGQETVCEYDAAGNLLHTQATERKSGSIIACDFRYNGHGQLTTITNAADAEGRRRVDTFTYHAIGPQLGYLASAVVDTIPAGLALTTSYEYDARGNLTRLTDPRGIATDFTVNALDQVVAKQTQGATFGERERAEYHYDAADRLVRVDVENRDAAGTLNPTNAWISTLYEYDSLQRLTRLMEEEVVTYAYLTNEFAYDGEDELILHRSPPAVHGLDANAVAQFEWDERGLFFREIRAPGTPHQSTARCDYDLNGNLRRKHTGQEAVAEADVACEWDALHRLTRVTDAMGNETHYKYDLNDNLTRVVDYGETNDVPGNAGNRRLAETRYEYDSFDRCVRRIGSFFDIFTDLALGDGGNDTTWDYAPNGQVTRLTNDRGFATRYDYDSVGRLVRGNDARTNRVEYAYDANGNLLSETEMGRSDLGGPDEIFVRSYGYDALNRCVADWDNVGNTNRYAYDSRANLVRHTDPRGNDASYDYDGLGRAVRTTHYIGAREGGVTINTSHVEYQTTRLVSATDGNGNMTHYAYDALDRRVRTTLADGTISSLVWSPRSNVERATNANGTVVTHLYDVLDRCVQKNITPGPDVANTTTQETFAYDGLSRLVRAQNNASEVTFAYDSLGHLVRESSAAPALGFPGLKVDGLHDAHGLMLAQTNPSGRIVEFLYDELDRVTRMRTRARAGAQPQLLGTFAYSGPDRLVRVTRPNRIQTDYTYSGLAGVPNPPGDFGWGEIQRVRHSISGTTPVIDERLFAHDRSQNKTLRTLTAPFAPGGATNRQDLQYDALDRLVQSVTTRDGLPVQDATYVLDPNGNRQSVISGGAAQSYLMDNALPQPADFQVNQYTVTPFDARQYDENGNLHATLSGDPLAPDVRQFVYDYADRLVAVQNTNGPVATYAYDALGRRIARVLYAGLPPVPAQTNRYLYAGGQVIEEEDGSGAVVAAQVWPHMHHGGSHARISGAGEVLFHHCDYQGSTLALTDAGGNVVERYDYDDFGRPRFLDAAGNPLMDAGGLPLNASAVGNPYLFHGHRWDDETGLYFICAGKLKGKMGSIFEKIKNSPILKKLGPAVQQPTCIDLQIESDGEELLPRRRIAHLDPNTGSTLTRTFAMPHVFDQKGRAYAGNNPWSAKPIVRRTSGLKDTLKSQVRMAGGGRGADADLLPWGAKIFRSGGDTTVHPWGVSAFATGSSVAFGAGRDLHTMAHELAHVVQQSSGVHSVLKTKHGTVKSSINNMR